MYQYLLVWHQLDILVHKLHNLYTHLVLLLKNFRLHKNNLLGKLQRNLWRGERDIIVTLGELKFEQDETRHTKIVTYQKEGRGPTNNHTPMKALPTPCRHDAVRWRRQSERILDIHLRDLDRRHIHTRLHWELPIEDRSGEVERDTVVEVCFRSSSWSGPDSFMLGSVIVMMISIFLCWLFGCNSLVACICHLPSRVDEPKRLTSFHKLHTTYV